MGDPEQPSAAATTSATRSAERRDLPALTEIYNHYVERTVTTFDLEPFTVDGRSAWFDHYAVTGPHRLLVSEHDHEVIGYATSSTFRRKAAYDQSVETSVYLRPDRTGRGHGQALYLALLAALADEPVHRAYAGVALPNDASVRLHERLGFTSVGTFSHAGFKFGRYVDVQWFERALP